MPSLPQLSNPALAAGYLIAVWLGFRAWNLPDGWLPYGLGLLGVVAALAWFANLRRYRAVADTPTARIASSPQGYVEWSGRGIFLPGERLCGPLSGLPCLWYRYRRERKVGDRYVLDDSGTSFDTIALTDDSATALIDPDGAEIVTARRRSWLEDDYRNTEWLLLEGEPLYALGEHTHLAGVESGPDKDALGQLLAEWKRDKAWLLCHFDKDGDGQISLTEWEAVREAALNSLQADASERHSPPGWPMLRCPHDGRLFLVADRSPRQLARRYAVWAWLHLAVLAAAVTAFWFKTGA